MNYTPTDLQVSRLHQAFTEIRRFPGWSVLKQFYTAEASKGAEGDLDGLRHYLVGLFSECLDLEQEYATRRIKSETYQASD